MNLIIRNVSFTGLLLVVSGLLLVLCSMARAGEVVRLANGEWPPYLSRGFKHGGVLAHIVSEAFANEGIEVKYEYYPWKRGYEMAKEGELDGTIIWLKTAEREHYFLFSDPVFYDRGAFFHLKTTDFDWQSYDDLTKYTFGVTLGYSYGETFDKLVAERKIRVQGVSLDEFNLGKLLEGRVQVSPVNIEIGYYLLHTKYGPDAVELVTHHPKLFNEGRPMHILISRQNPKAREYVEAFNRGFRKVVESGNYDRYLLASRRGEYLLE